jgi:hypothetical protein
LRQLRKEARRSGGDGEVTTPTPIPDDLTDALALEIGELKALLNKFIREELISVDDQGVFEILNPEAFDRYLSYLEMKDRFEHTDS